MKNKSSGYITIHNYASAVLALYKVIDVGLNVTKIKRFVPIEKKVRKDRAYTNKDFNIPEDTFTILKGFKDTESNPMLKYLYLKTIEGNGKIPTPWGLIEVPFENGTARLPVEFNYSSRS